MYARADIRSPGPDVRTCSYCDRPTTREIELDPSGAPPVYSCSTCGQREVVSWRYVPAHVIEEVVVVEEPHIILCEH